MSKHELPDDVVQALWEDFKEVAVRSIGGVYSSSTITKVYQDKIKKLEAPSDKG